MINSPTNLIVTAHPDDESIFFAGLVLSRPKTSWEVICVTDGNADGNGTLRKQQIETACELLGIKKLSFLGLPDNYSERLDQSLLVSKLKDAYADEVFTHEIFGEYGHPHHQDVSASTHVAFEGRAPVWSIAYNVYPQLKIELPEESWKKKFRILSEVYFSETKRFFQLIPTTSSEGFVQIPTNVITDIYQYLIEKGALPPTELSQYEELRKFLPFFKERKNRHF